MIEAEVLGNYLIVEGFKDVKIKSVEEFLGLIRAKSGRCQVQVLDAAFIAGFEHIYFAVLNALKSFRLGLNISKSLAVEILLYASGQDQIRRAIEILGVKQSSRNIALVIVANNRDEAIFTLKEISEIIDGEADQRVIDLTEEKIQGIINSFGISNLELDASMRGTLKDALKHILIERSALLITQI
jgi:tRNA threonylcarbamoyladenosine modification (KEOPS) complex Cgi121 subunit